MTYGTMYAFQWHHMTYGTMYASQWNLMTYISFITIVAISTTM